MMGGGSNLTQESDRFGLPIDLIGESEGFKRRDDDIFPDNAQTVAIFSDCLTQWRTGPRGVIGLDYNVLPFIFNTRKINAEDEEQIFEGVKIMEQAAIQELRK